MHRIGILLGWGVCAAGFAWTASKIPLSWFLARGYEYEWVAWSLARGHGYTFEGSWRWLGPFTEPGTYSPTAWVEPVQTSLMAAAFWLLGEDGRLALILLNFVWAMATVAAVFLLARRLAGPVAGMAAALLLTALITLYGEILYYTGAAFLPGLLITCCMLRLVRCVESPSLRRGAVLGATIGLAHLTHAGTILFAPLAAVTILLLARPTDRRLWMTAVAVPLLAAAVVSPWTIRNYRTFGELVPIRTGSGFILHAGIPSLARTFAPETASSEHVPAPPWTARSARDALSKLDRKHQGELNTYSLDTIGANPPPGYEHYNEAQRDAVYGGRARRFALDHPWLLARLVAAKAVAYLFTNWRASGLVTVMAILGVLACIRNARVWLVLAFAASLWLPYLLTLPIYYRYRYPTDPLVCVLAGVLVSWLFARWSAWREVRLP